MRTGRLIVVGFVAATLPITMWAQKGDLTHRQAAEDDAHVDFGVLPTGPLGPLPCLQVGGIGGPADPCAFKLHHLTPEETTIFKGGQVTFQIHGGGHAMHLFEVSKDTTRDDIGQFLCVGPDPTTLDDPSQHPCNLSASNAAARHVILDGHDDVVIVAASVPAGAPPPPNPVNLVWSEPGRLMSVGGHQFLNGGTVPAGPQSNGQLVTYRFLKTGRYLVTCMNRTHFLNDWMFGFVNVVGGDESSKH